MRNIFTNVYVNILISFTLLQYGNGQFTTDGCGTFKGCYLYPSGCVNTNCMAAVTYHIAGVKKDLVQFELMRPVSPGSTNYIALGLSKDGNSMGDDSVMACMAGETSAPGAVTLSYNKGKKNEAISNEANAANIKNVIVTNINGILYCTFHRPITIAINDQSRVFPLDMKYTLLLALGDKSPNGFIEEHYNGAKGPRATADKINVAVSTAIAKDGGNLRNYRLAKSHGCLMIAAWLMMTTIGILTARYHRNTLPNLHILKKPFWFQAHRACNLFAIVLMIVGAICIVVAKGVEIDDAHQIVGLIALILAFIQPIGALFRCHPDTTKRPIFNWMHRIGGVGAWLCAEAAIFLATYFTGFGLMPNDANGAGWTARIFIFVFWGAVLLSIIILEGLNLVKTKNGISEMPINTGRASMPDLKRKANAWTLRIILMIVIDVIAISVAIGLIIIIALA